MAHASRGVPAIGRRRRVMLVIATLLGLLLAALDQTIVSTALPTIVGDLAGDGGPRAALTPSPRVDGVAGVE